MQKHAKLFKVTPTAKILKKDNLVSFQQMAASDDDGESNPLLIDENLDSGRPLPNDFDSFAARLLDAAKALDKNKASGSRAAASAVPEQKSPAASETQVTQEHNFVRNKATMAMAKQHKATKLMARKMSSGDYDVAVEEGCQREELKTAL